MDAHSPLGQEVPGRLRLSCLLSHAISEFLHLNDGPLVATLSHQFDAIVHLNVEGQPPPLNPD